MFRGEVLERGRESFRRQEWGDAFAHLSAADHEAPLEPEDLERLATGLYFVGLHFLYALTSDTVNGVGRDAERIAKAITSRIRTARAA